VTFSNYARLHNVEKFRFDIAVVNAIHMVGTCSQALLAVHQYHFRLAFTLDCLGTLQTCHKVVNKWFWRLSTKATSVCSAGFLHVLSRWILSWAHHFNFYRAIDSLMWLAISVWFWLWWANLNLTKDGNPTFSHRTGRKALQSFQGKKPDVISSSIDMKSLSRSQKPVYVLSWDRLCSVQQTPLVFPTKGSALRNSCWGMQGWSLVLERQKGNIESFQCGKVLKNWNTLGRSYPFAWLSFLQWRSFMWCIAQPNIVLLVGEKGSLMSFDVISLNMDTKSLGRSQKWPYVSAFDCFCSVQQISLIFPTSAEHGPWLTFALTWHGP